MKQVEIMDVAPIDATAPSPMYWCANITAAQRSLGLKGLLLPRLITKPHAARLHAPMVIATGPRPVTPRPDAPRKRRRCAAWPYTVSLAKTVRRFSKEQANQNRVATKG